MFYNSEMLTKRGPLARVWMASHLNSKLTKSNLLATSIPSSVSSILGQDLLPMALRLSGQLLLGVARIYSRKAKYLLDDCQETLARVKKAFKPGQVDMDEAPEARNRDAITLRADNGGLEDVMNFDNYWDLNMADLAPVAGSSNARKNNNKANLADITLPDHAEAFYNNDDDYGVRYEAIYDYGPDGALDSEAGLDLGLDLGEDYAAATPTRAGKRKASDALGEDDDDAEDRSVELGRDAADSLARASARGSVGPFDFDGDLDLGRGDKDAIGGDQLDLGGMDDADFNFGEPDVFADIGGGGGDEEEVRLRDKTPQPSSVNGDVEDSDLTPRTAAKLAAATSKSGKNGQPPRKKQVVDKVTEQEWDKAAIEARKQLLFTQPSYLPRSRTHLRLLERAADPTYYLPKQLDTSGNLFMFAPPGLAAPELQKLFTLPSRRAMIKAAGRERSPSVRDVELGRRRAPTVDAWGQEDVWRDIGAGNDDFGQEQLGGDDLFDVNDGYEPPMPDNDFQFDVDEDDAAGRASPNKDSTATLTPRRKKQRIEAAAAFAQEEQEGLAVSEGPLAVFDDSRASAGQGSTQQQQQTNTVTQSLVEEEEDALLETGMMPGKWSRNTVKAVGVLRNELSGPDGEPDDDKTLDFGELAEKATRRAAASMFFELLVLSTRECIKVEQSEAYGDITVSAKDQLWSSAAPVETQA